MKRTVKNAIYQHKLLSPYLGCDSLVTVLLRAAFQCKLFPQSHAALFHSSVVMNHLSVYQLFLFTSDFEGLTPLVKPARNLRKMAKLHQLGSYKLSKDSNYFSYSFVGQEKLVGRSVHTFANCQPLETLIRARGRLKLYLFLSCV